MSVAKINSKMMFWARQYAGYVNGYEKDLPKSIRDKYKSWEAGETYPTWVQLRNVSKKYKVPTAFFFMKNPPAYNQLPKLMNYRKLNTESLYNNISPYLIDNIHTSQNRRNIYMDLSDDLNENIAPFNVFEGDLNKYELSSFIRETLSISLNTQKSWIRNAGGKDIYHYTFLNNWKEVLTEKMGVLIFETYDVNIEEMRGLSIYHENVPIILLNGKDSVNGRIFSLFHELTHLLMGESAICGDDLTRNTEIFCNAVSGEFLVPSKDIINNFDGTIDGLSHIYGVSSEVILRRLLDLDLITKKEYDLKTSHQYIYPDSKKSRGNYYRNMIKYNGKPYYSIVLEAYDAGLINGSEFSKFTGLKANQAQIIGEMIFGGIS